MAQLRAVDYLRVSTEEQVKGYGIAAAGRKTTGYIERKGWAHAGTFADEGLSGSLEAHERPGLKRLMSLAHASERGFDMVVVSEGRAIGRTGRAFWRWVWDLEDLGVYVAVVRGDYDNSTPAGRSRMRADADKAEEEREIIRDRTQGGIQEKAADGRHPGGQARYGYRIENQGKLRESRLILDECDGSERCSRADVCTAMHETAVLRRGRTLFIESGGHWRRTVSALNAEGHTNRSGGPWTVPNFRNRLIAAVDNEPYVFRSKANALLDAEGRPVWGESISIALPALFTEAEVKEFRSTKRLRTQVRSSKGRVYTLTGRIKSLCGGHYVGGTASDSPGSHYRCSSKTEKFPGAPTCDCSQIDAIGVEEWAWSEVCGLLGDAEQLKALATKELERHGGQQVDHSSRLAELDQQVAEQADAIDLTTVMAAKQAARRGLKGAEAEASVDRMVNPLMEELARLEEMRTEVSAWQAELALAEGRVRDLQSLAALAHSNLDELDPVQQARFLDLLDITACLTAPPEPMRKGAPCTLAQWFRDQDRLVPVLDDAGWAAVAPILGDHRRVLEVLLLKPTTGARWSALEAEYGTTSLRTYWRRWKASGAWDRAMQALPKEGSPVMRQHPMPSLHLHGMLDPGLILATVSEGHGQASVPWGQFLNVAYRFSMATSA